LVRLALLEIEALVSDDGPTALDERERALLAFVRGALAAPERVTADQVESLRRLGFVDGDILDALAHGANIVAISSLLRLSPVRDGCAPPPASG
jgi:alkylhydroperoxidase family enzyme